MTFSRKILVGLGAGVLTGLMLGELVAPLSIAAEGYVRLLQMTVLPYVTISIIASLGGLSLAQARLLGVRGGLVVVALWAIAFAVTCAMPLAFPRTESASFFSTTLVHQPEAFDFVGLYIPANPFNALANNVVPAVVLFSVVVGVALIGVDRKAPLLDMLQTATVVIGRATHGVGRLMPYGLFAIAAVAAGTLTIEQLQRIQVYLITYVAFALIVALWVLPGLVAALTGIRIRDLLSRSHDSVIVAFVAADLFIVLPGLIEACKDLVGPRRSTDTTLPDESVASARAGPEVIVPVTFNFPHTGKLLSLSFIPFAAWFADASLPADKYPQLLGAGFLSFFGSLSSAVPFLLDLFRLPADTFQLFLATGVVNSRFGTLVAAMHTIAVGILGSLALTGGLGWHVGRLVRFALVTTLLVVATIGGLRVLFGTVLRHEFAGADLIYGMTPLNEGAAGHITPSLPDDEPSPGQSVLQTIRSRGTLRVLVLPDRMPFAFPSREGRLVGLDVELAHALARDLEVGVEFFQADYDRLQSLLSRGVCDIAMSGVAITPERASDMLFSVPYLDETLAFVTRDHLRGRFRDWSAINELGSARIGVPDLPFYRRAVAARAPRLEIVTLRTTEDLFKPDDDLMAYVLPAERGSVLTLLHPAYSVVVPEPGTIKLPVAYALSRGDERWAAFVNTWLELKQRDGSIDALYRHWILGQNPAPVSPRWSVVRNVLGWVD